VKGAKLGVVLQAATRWLLADEVAEPFAAPDVAPEGSQEQQTLIHEYGFAA
jgi:hypothetical protein